ncbi:algn-2 [Pristionchus pacificus]|uniref:Alpha-1,3/1,6-mannosyltransferase ALG2 n=1 Tax=Pristionchus pacificus TaxID=54126 RepID=A0A454XX59_PRIPA|nr:algn-2 [Pristionchus pacificus]|eukprot:PDM61872.1 algn-2 [Pristionchus pacificus]
MRVTVLHPDLGIGGAERLIVDAALALQTKGHTVKVVTNQFDASHAFTECSQLDITTSFSWVPRQFCGRFKAAWAYLRMCLAAVYVALFMQQDVILCDQISACLPLLRLLTRGKTRLVFYCHFPDLLLTDRATALKSLYRKLIDGVEAWSINYADVICVNSNFTASIVRLTFPRLAARPLTVLYPSLNTAFFDTTNPKRPSKLEREQPGFDHMFVSLNRFEGKKNHQLAIDAFVELGRRLRPSDYARCHLVVAGGYDRKNEENLLVYRQLRDHALDCGLSSKAHFFLQSPSDEEKLWLLRNARAVLYTPSNEHFGIVPVESMYCGTPVIGVDSGGPKESIEQNKTGLLVEANVNSFCDAMLKMIQNEDLRNSMSEEGPRRVNRLFAFDAFADALNKIVQ